MKPRYVNEMSVGGSVAATFVIRSKELRRTRNGDRYLALEVADRTGALQAVVFDPSAEALDVPTGSVAEIRGRITFYRGMRRISVDSLQPARTWDPNDFIATGPRPVQEAYADFTELVRSVRSKDVRAVLIATFRDRAFLERFKRCPASRSRHHAYLGGLLEHTVAVARTCDGLAERYAGVDRDLLVAAALLHDVGKVDELTFDTSISYTDEGRLLGHVVLGLRRARAAIDAARMNPDRAVRLEHVLLSHHGELEWGSPKRPATIEALLLHHVDNLDAKASGLSGLLAGAASLEEGWTDADNLFRRPLYVPRLAEDDRIGRPDEEDEAILVSA